MKKNKLLTVLTVGFALFAMFFGAGNLILPPYIGLKAGADWSLALFGFFITAILSPFLGVVMVAKSGTAFVDLGKRIHPQFINVLALLIILCIGPLVSIPRTGATTFEIGVLPFFPDFNNVLFAIIFFSVVLALSISQTKIVDIIGMVLTPFLLISLLILVLLGVLNPMKMPETPVMTGTELFTFSFVEGYQTLDVLASVIFAGMIIAAVMQSGYASISERINITIWAGVVSTVFLLLIYGGLIYLGATTDYQTQGEVSRTALLLHISHSVLGKKGAFVISIVIALACLTTAIALTSATGAFFEKLTKGKLSYKIGVLLCTVVSILLSINSVDTIISYAINILLFIYPITFAMMLYILVFGKKVKSRQPYIAGIVVAGLVSLISVAENLKLPVSGLYQLKSAIPLSDYSLEWLLPSLVAFLLVAMLSSNSPIEKSANKAE